MMKLAKALIRPWGIEERSDLSMAVQFGNKVVRRAQDGNGMGLFGRDTFCCMLEVTDSVMARRMIDDR